MSALHHATGLFTEAQPLIQTHSKERVVWHSFYFEARQRKYGQPLVYCCSVASIQLAATKHYNIALLGAEPHSPGVCPHCDAVQTTLERIEPMFIVHMTPNVDVIRKQAAVAFATIKNPRYQVIDEHRVQQRCEHRALRNASGNAEPSRGYIITPYCALPVLQVGADKVP
jgi:glutaredoxin